MFSSFFCDPCCTSSKNVRKDDVEGESIFSLLSCGGRQKSKKDEKMDDFSKIGITSKQINNFDTVNLKSSEFKEFRAYLRQKFKNNNQEYARQVKLIQSRPELLPYYILRYQKDLEAQVSTENKWLENSDTLSEYS